MGRALSRSAVSSVLYCRFFFAWYRFHWSLARAWSSTASVWVRWPSTVVTATSTASTLMVKLTGRRLASFVASSLCSLSSWASLASISLLTEDSVRVDRSSVEPQLALCVHKRMRREKFIEPLAIAKCLDAAGSGSRECARQVAEAQAAL